MHKPSCHTAITKKPRIAMASSVAPFWRNRYRSVYDMLWVPTKDALERVDVGLYPYIDVYRRKDVVDSDRGNDVTLSLIPSQGTRRRHVFIDPGLRNFLTFYSPDGWCGKIGGEGVNERLAHLVSKYNTAARQLQTKQCDKIMKCIEDEVNTLHMHACRFLCGNFDAIFLPVITDGRASTPLRIIMSMSHERFRARLLRYARWCRKIVHDIPEHFTTKTCGVCGTCNDVGAATVFTCSSCGTELDRDLNAARNICLLALTTVMDLKDCSGWNNYCSIKHHKE